LLDMQISNNYDSFGLDTAHGKMSPKVTKNGNIDIT